MQFIKCACVCVCQEANIIQLKRAAEISSAQRCVLNCTQMSTLIELLCTHATRWTEHGITPLFLVQ